MIKRVTLVALLSLCTLLPAMGQNKPADDKDEVVRITTNLVQVDVVVTKDGQPVPNLKAEDFDIYEDGRRQNITSFAFISNVSSRSLSAAPDKAAADAPPGIPPEPVNPDAPHRTIAVVVDDLGLSVESMNAVRRQLRNFITEQVQPNDLVAIIRTSGEIGALQQFTNDKRLLSRAVDQLRWNVCSRLRSVFPRYEQVRTKFEWESCDQFSGKNTNRALDIVLDALARVPGRKSMVLMSDDLPLVRPGEDESMITVGSTSGGSYMSGLADFYKIIEKAIRSSVVIYSVDTQGLQVTSVTAADNWNEIPRPGQTKPSPLDDPRPANALIQQHSLMLQQRREGAAMLAKKTGGFQVRNSNGFQLDRILEDQSGYYLLGYRPTDETFNRQFHQIKAKVKRSGLTVRTRFGFWGVSEEDAKRTTLSPRDETNLALISPFAKQDLEFELNAFFTSNKTDGSVVRSFIYLDAADLAFSQVNDRHETSLEIDGVIFGDNGAIEEQLKHSTVLSLRENEYRDALREGLRLRFDIPVKRPGSYQVRLALRDRTSSKIGSAGQFVNVPDLRSNRLALSGIVLRGSSEGITQQSVMTTPPPRRFTVNSDLYFAFLIYNASPNLTLETRLFRDGKLVKSVPAVPVDVSKNVDSGGVLMNSSLRLTPELEPGDYYLQVVVFDKTKDKQVPLTQWVQFEIVK
jgi:VWFA-related protein